MTKTISDSAKSVKFTVSFICPNPKCKKKITIKDEFIGYDFNFYEDARYGDHLDFRIKCPHCEKKVEVDLR